MQDAIAAAAKADAEVKRDAGMGIVGSPAWKRSKKLEKSRAGSGSKEEAGGCASSLDPPSSQSSRGHFTE